MSADQLAIGCLAPQQVEMQQLRDKFGGAGTGGDAASLAKERDEWQRKYEELTDKQSMQLAEFATKVCSDRLLTLLPCYLCLLNSARSAIWRCASTPHTASQLLT